MGDRCTTLPCHRITDLPCVNARSPPLTITLNPDERRRRGPDFGLSINEGQSVAKSMEVGTPGYCAPELLMRTNLTTSYDGKKADGALPDCFLSHVSVTHADSQAGQWCVVGHTVRTRSGASWGACHCNASTAVWCMCCSVADHLHKARSKAMNFYKPYKSSRMTDQVPVCCVSVWSSGVMLYTMLCCQYPVRASLIVGFRGAAHRVVKLYT